MRRYKRKLLKLLQDTYGRALLFTEQYGEDRGLNVLRQMFGVIDALELIDHDLAVKTEEELVNTDLGQKLHNKEDK